jgi:hypothetical protein
LLPEGSEQGKMSSGRYVLCFRHMVELQTFEILELQRTALSPVALEVQESHHFPRIVRGSRKEAILKRIEIVLVAL